MWKGSSRSLRASKALYASPTAPPPPPPSSGTGAGEKLANEAKGGQKVSCPHSVEEGKGRGLKCQGAVIRWTQYIRHKSRAYLTVYLRDNRCELHTGRNAQTRSVAH